MNLLKLFGGMLGVFLASIGVSFLVLSYQTPLPDPKAPEDIVLEFLIKDRPVNPEVLKSKLIAFKKEIRELSFKNQLTSAHSDSLEKLVKTIDEKYYQDIALKDSLNRFHIDSLQKEITVLETSMKVKDVEISDAQNQIDLLNQQLDVLNVKKTNLQAKEQNLKSLAKTYESLKIKDMSAILKNVDDDTVIRLYFQMKAKKRQNLLLALDQKRAANITRKLADQEQSL